MPSDPADPPVFGARVDGETITLKVPLCPADRLRRVDVFDFDDTDDETPASVWWASDPQTRQAKEGVVELWSGHGFAHHAPAPSTVPGNLDVAYTDPSGNGCDDVLPLGKITKAHLGSGEYWTHDGPKSAAQIEAGLGCDKQ
ncbi:hypothetical protein ACWER6_11990 [Streptomyces sp. NPDC004009]